MRAIVCQCRDRAQRKPRVKRGEKAGRTGLEPATTGSTVRYSNQLSYGPKLPARSVLPDWATDSLNGSCHSGIVESLIDTVPTPPRQEACRNPPHRCDAPPTLVGAEETARAEAGGSLQET